MHGIDYPEEAMTDRPTPAPTPETEAAIATWHSDPVQEQRDKAEDFARSLERQRDEAREAAREALTKWEAAELRRPPETWDEDALERIAEIRLKQP